jgi:hypothetical protein
VQRETGNMQHAPDCKQHAASNHDMQRDRQRAACSMQQTTDNVEKTTDGVHRTTGNKATGSGQQGNMRHAADRAQKMATTRQRMQQTTCNRQQTTCKRTRAHARCHRTHTALPHFVCDEQRAAHNLQHARSIALDNQCATRHRRAQTPHTRFNIRPMPQHATNTHGSDNTQQAIQCTG